MSEETKKTAEAPEQEAKETEAAPQEAPETAAAPEKEAEAEPADAKKKDGWFNKKAREMDAVKAKLDAAEKNAAQAKDQLLRMAAEYENYRKRSTREADQKFNDGVSFAVNQIIPILDTLEMAARVKSHLRRYTRLGDIHASEQTEELTNGRLCFRTNERVLYADGEPVKLTATETKIMELLMRNLGRVFPAEEIYRRVWEEEAYAPENTVMVHIRRIREKIELNPKEPEYLKVVWGIGYKMEKK